MLPTIRTMGSIVALCACAWAIDSTRAISQYQKQLWQVEQGLPRNYVMAMAEFDGYLLVGTEEGAARFDGLRFTAFDGGPALKLSQRWILAVIATREGSTWIGTFDGWLYQLKGAQVTNQYYARSSVFAILEDGAGGIWASTRDGVIRITNRQFERVPGLAGPPDTAWNTLTLDSQGAIWIVTREGLYRSANGSISQVRANRDGSEVLSVVNCPQGGVWVGDSQGLSRIRLAHGQLAKNTEPRVSAPVVALLNDRDGQLWAGTWGGGLYRVGPNGVGGWTTREGLADNFVRTLYEDHEGDLWIGTRSGGLSRWKDSTIVPYGVPEGLKGEFASTVVADSHGDLWFGTWRGGLYKRVGYDFLEQPIPAPRLYCTVRALAFDPSGNPWIGNWEGLYGFDGHTYLHYSTADSPYHHVSTILFDHAKRMWLGTSEHGVFVFADAKPSDRVESRLEGEETTALMEDSRHRVWVATSNGFGWFDSDSADFRRVAGLKDSIASITEDSKGRIWAAALSGSLYVISPTGMSVLDTRNGLPGQPLYRVIDDGAGAFWISSRDGIVELNSHQVDEALTGGSQRLTVVLHQQSDGMRTVECHRLSQPAGARDRDGIVWFPTTRGFVSIDPRRVRPLAAPQTTIEESRADGKLLASYPELRVAPGTHSLEIRYSALNLSNPSQIQFRYRMEGFDPDWVDSGTERTAHYNRLPMGRRRFLVSARMPGGEWSAPAASIDVDQLPMFYQKVPFLLLMVAICGGAIATMFYWRVHVIRSRFGLIVAERNRIAREWHDTLLAGFSAISWQLEATVSQLENLPDSATESLRLALRMVQHYRAEARSVIWDLREKRDESETLGNAISGVLRRVAGTDIESNVQVAGNSKRLPQDLERNILRICHEASSNAKRHGAAKRIHVFLEYQKDSLCLRVEDDGQGFEPRTAVGTASGHFGMAVMRERAERFGGELHVASRPGGGTIVEALIPLAHMAPNT